MRDPIPFGPPVLARSTSGVLRLTLSDGSLQEKAALVSHTNNCYEVGRVLQESIYGEVRYARPLDPPERIGGPYRSRISARGVAIKKYSKSKIRARRSTFQEDPLSEIAAMQLIGENPHLMTPIECFMDETNVYVIMDYMDGGELLDLVMDNGYLPEEQARDYFRQIATGVAHLHSLHLCHRDLSLENVLITRETKSCKVIDFGLCLRVPVDENGKVIKIRSRGFCGKHFYVAPEIYGQEPWNPMLSDIWSLGIMLYMMVTGRTLVNEAIALDPSFRRIFKGQLGVMLTELSVNLSPLCRDLLIKILKPNPEERLNIAGIRAHPWMRNETLPLSGNGAETAVCA